MTRAAVVSCSLGLFALLAAGVLLGGPLVRFDAAAVQFLVAHRTAWLTEAMLLVSEVHETRAVLGATALLAAWLLLRARGLWAAYLGAIPTGMGLNWLLKQVFQRARPDWEPLVRLETFSFPSAHAVASTLFYGSLCIVFLLAARSRGARAAAIAGAVAMVAAVCFSRVYLGVHHPSDVLAGACVGCAWLAIWPAAVRLRPGCRGRAGTGI